MGQGRGGIAKSEPTDVGFKTERGKVQTTKGAIVGQFLVDGEQVKGDAKSSFVELVAAAERDASDRINRDRIPRQYQKAVKEYFSNLEKKTGKKPADPKPQDASKEDGPSAPADETKSKAPE